MTSTTGVPARPAGLPLVLPAGRRGVVPVGSPGGRQDAPERRAGRIPHCFSFSRRSGATFDQPLPVVVLKPAWSDADQRLTLVVTVSPRGLHEAPGRRLQARGHNRVVVARRG